ncbi:MAG: glutamate 5-kinase [Candidatus Omnitrophica bacterium]|nr:glutamate 5-kinase [Candidatus Omnitrophota bacterium]
MKREKIFKGVKRAVVKIGTQVLTSPNNRLDVSVIEHLVQQICRLKKEKEAEVIIVTSGAIVAGMHVLGWEKRPGRIDELQAAASIGQSRLMRVYERLFKEEGINVGQILLTRDAFTVPSRKRNAGETVETLLKFKVVPVINENDSVAVDEIKLGDNDTLAAFVTELVSADILVIVTDVDGLSVCDPKKTGRCEVIGFVDDFSAVQGIAESGVPSKQGIGGMKSKIAAAKYVTERGASCVILNGKKTWSIKDAFEGKDVGTVFVPCGKKSRG